MSHLNHKNESYLAFFWCWKWTFINGACLLLIGAFIVTDFWSTIAITLTGFDWWFSFAITFGPWCPVTWFAFFWTFILSLSYKISSKMYKNITSHRKSDKNETYHMVHYCKVLLRQSLLRILVLANQFLVHRNRVRSSSFWCGVEFLKIFSFYRPGNISKNFKKF